MKKLTSIKTRITIWYTTLMLVLILIVLALVGGLSYSLSVENIEKDVVLQVAQVTENLGRRPRPMPEAVEDNRDFKNVSIYDENGQYIVGQYNYDVAGIPFREGNPRRETVGNKDFIVYDVKQQMPPMMPAIRPEGLPEGVPNGFPEGVPETMPGALWIRCVESVNSTVIFGRSAFSVLLIIIPFILLLTALGGYYITRKAFLPINSITKTANAICAQGDVKQRVEIAPGAREDELFSLAGTLNTMLDKIETLILQEKQFTSDASHELRTPISVILAQGEYLLDIAENEKEKELAQDIVDKAEQVSKLVSRLLLLARIDQNRQKISKEKVDVCLLLDVATENLQKQAADKGIRVNVQADENLSVMADESLLISAISNLISNAIKYGNEGGYISVTATDAGGQVMLTVQDNGIGIPPEHVEHIWTRFYRVDDVRNDEYGSSGLGLSMVKSIVELHGGRVSVKSQVGEGTVFSILLPKE